MTIVVNRRQLKHQYIQTPVIIELHCPYLALPFTDSQSRHYGLLERTHIAKNSTGIELLVSSLLLGFAVSEGGVLREASPVVVFRGGMMIKVKTLTGKEIEIDIDSTDTIHRIKERVEEKEGIPPVQQR